MLSVGEIGVAKGEKKWGTLKISDCQGNTVDIPVFLMNGNGEGPTLCVTAGIHGAEYPSIETALRLAQNTKLRELNGSLIILPVVNVAAFFERSIYVCPYDSKNLNRVFPGKADGSMSEVIAHKIMEEVTPKATHYVDLHGGDMVEALHPFILVKKTGMEEIDHTAEALCLGFGIESIMEITKESTGWTGQGTIFVSMAEKGIPSLIAEAGQCGQLDETSVTLLYNGMLNIMKILHILPGKPKEPPKHEIFHHFVWLTAECQGVFYAKVRASEWIKRDQPIGEIRDFTGNILQPFVSPVEGRVLFLVTSPATKKDNVLMGIGTKEV
jgi:hypothetical protein